ncbi:MAG: response regulator [Thermoguttaceae bacterium]|jgi:PAS domain S-box-containing protein
MNDDRQENEQYRLLFECNPNPMWVYDVETLAFLAVNQAAIQEYGWSRAEFLAMTIKDIRPGEEVLPLLAAVAAQHGGVAEPAGIWRHRKKDGTLIDMEITTSSIAFQKRPARLVLACDITDLRQNNALLEQRVAQRTAEAERRAIQLRAMAVELSQTEQRERRQLAQVLHDQLQQLLVAARMKVGRLRRATDGNEATSKIIDELDSLISQSITESRSLTVELSPPVLYDGGLAAGLEWLARRMEEKHGLTVEVHADLNANPADENMSVFLFQAVRELLFNVVKHARARQATVRMVRIDEERLRIEVRDDGAGCDAAAIRNRLDRGGGFGLMNIRERVEHLGGRMSIEASPGRGTRVLIVVRSSSPAVTDAAIEPHSPPQNTDMPARSGPLRILVADDHPIVRKGLADMLREQRAIEVVFEACDGQQAVEMALEHRPDLVMMDVTMPRLNGIEATRQIKAALPQVRVIALSMHHEADMAQAMCEAGAVVYLRKDAPSATLLAAIFRHGRREA